MPGKKSPLIILIVLFSFILTGKAILFVLDLRSQENDLTLSDNHGETAEMLSGKVEGLPGDFPVYQRSELIVSALSDNAKGRSYMWETDEEAGLVYEHLKSELRIKGWQLTNDSSLGSSSVVSFEKGGIVGFLAVFKGDSGKSIISVTIRNE